MHRPQPPCTSTALFAKIFSNWYATPKNRNNYTYFQSVLVCIIGFFRSIVPGFSLLVGEVATQPQRTDLRIMNEHPIDSHLPKFLGRGCVAASPCSTPKTGHIDNLQLKIEFFFFICYILPKIGEKYLSKMCAIALSLQANIEGKSEVSRTT